MYKTSTRQQQIMVNLVLVHGSKPPGHITSTLWCCSQSLVNWEGCDSKIIQPKSSGSLWTCSTSVLCYCNTVCEHASQWLPVQVWVSHVSDDEKKRGQYIKNETLYFTTLPRSPHCTDFYKIWFAGISPRHHHNFISTSEGVLIL